MIGFKVCKILDGKFYSASISAASDVGTVEYVMNTEAVPVGDNGPLSVFQKREQAEDWLEEWVGIDADARAHFALFKCNYIPVSGAHLFINSGDISTTSSMHISKAASGTLLASGVTIIRRTSWE